ncbi:MAG: hypothetical protein ABI867_18935 [Kofleriaceae bacterium]
MRSFLLMFAIACGSSPAPAPPAPAPPVPAVVAPVDAAEPDAAQPIDAPVTAPIACTTDDDCWLDGNTPIARPSSERGKKLRPCKDSERLPVCKAGVCGITAYKC